MSWSPVFSKYMLRSKLSSLPPPPQSLSLSLLLMYLPTDRIQQILSYARCAALRQPTVPTGQNSCSKGLQTFGFPPFLPDRPPWQARAGLRLLYVFTSHRLPLLGERYVLLVSGFLNAELCLPRHWVEETSGQEDWGQGWVGGWNNIYHLSKSLISRQIVFELLGAVWVITEMQQIPKLKDPQHNSMQKSHSAKIWKIVLLQYGFKIGIWCCLD